MAQILILVASITLFSFAASQLVTKGSYFRNMKASGTGETDSLIEEAFFTCDREKECLNVVKSKTQDDVKATREDLITEQIETYDFVYDKEEKQFAVSNVALGKNSTQSSLFVFSVNKFPSWLAVDGAIGIRVWVDANSGSDFGCAHTLASPTKKEHWRVDLGARFLITRVKVYDRKDCCHERLSNFDIRIGDKDEAGRNPVYAQNRIPARPAEDYIFEFAPKGMGAGRYLFIESNTANQMLNICEVEVYGFENI